MTALIILLLNLGASLIKPKSWLEAENAALRQQLVVLQRQVRGRVQFTNSDRLFFIQLYRWFPSVLKAMTIMRPETVMRWHRAGFRRYWRWKSWNLGGRPKIAADLRALIRRISVENRLWGAPRIHGELVLSENLIRLGSRIIGENHRMIADDVRASAFARNVRCRLVQAAAPACSREPVPSPSTQHRVEACAASSSTARQ
jgi:hypothetical protein